MCGILGSVAASDAAAPDGRRFPAALSRMARRGPDGSGVWSSKDGRIRLGHRRLAVIDLSEMATQPMLNIEGDVAVVFNGAIYNHAELRGELSARGYRFATDHSDTEVIVNGYRAWSIDGLLERLVGMFAFALVDLATGELFLCRDRLGVKPLFYEVSDGVCRFASQLDAVLAVSGRPAALDWDEVPGYLGFLSSPGPRTLIQGVRKLPPGQYAAFDRSGTLSVRAYWSRIPGSAMPDAALPASGDRDQRLLDLLRQSVRRRLIADVPIGLFLSGGVDSTMIATLAAEAGADGLDAYTIRYEDDAFADETAAAAATAARLGFRHHVVSVSADSVCALTDAAMDALDEPNGDWVCLPLHALSQAARDAGSKVVLSGEGADELFLGYPGYFSALRFEEKYGRRLRQVPRGLLERFEGLLWRFLPGGRLKQEYGNLPGRITAYGSAFLSGARGFGEYDIYRLFGGGGGGRRAVGRVRSRAADILGGSGPADPEDGVGVISRLEFSNRLPELLLMRLDRMTMAHGLEGRVPFLDQDVVEHVAAQDSTARLGDGRPKALLRAALEREGMMRVEQTDKVGFGAPVAAWLRGPMGSRVAEELNESPLFRDGPLWARVVFDMMAEHRSLKADRAQEIWAIYTLHRWFDRALGAGKGVSESGSTPA